MHKGLLEFSTNGESAHQQTESVQTPNLAPKSPERLVNCELLPHTSHVILQLLHAAGADEDGSDTGLSEHP